MPEFAVHYTTVASTCVTVTADDVSDAIEKADRQVGRSLCHQCAREVELGGEWELDVVYNNETGKQVWQEGGH